MSAAAEETEPGSFPRARGHLVDLSNPVIAEAIRAAEEAAWNRGFQHGRNPAHTIHANPHQVDGPRAVLPFVP